ncbi:DNA alkylation repair protein [Alkalimarinus sediminis]|uniref:DNA alkylation repair protein n=1 Tax=Alkalimarinus sediminis TaxID=1632866 RepID=A0A9E8HHA5_9ALTE|nr:DNA alkylation repair protein [Alkalimarinus sediminis]UZW74653.1 DNA alkylation repair protein [Alkalimarinus sediminis]
MPEPLKNAYNQDYIERLASSIQASWPAFDKQLFVSRVMDSEWEDKELKARMKHISAMMHECLSLPFDRAIAVLLEVSQGFGGFEGMFFPDYVEQFGVDDWELSVLALETLTQYSSSEFAVRPMIIRDPSRMMEVMLGWASHENYHVRRLASEGCRPRLPWAMALPEFKQDPRLILPILNKLKQDESLYVRRSVANNLNDIAKDNPDVVLKWCCDHIGQHPDTDWIIKHGCRTLLKQATPEAMALFGYADATSVNVTDLLISNDKLSIGDDLRFGFTVSTQREALSKLRIEYIVDYVKANGRRSPKVFQVSESDFNQREVAFERKHSFRQMTTRKHYPGVHQLSIRVNGEIKATLEFDLY